MKLLIGCLVVLVTSCAAYAQEVWMHPNAGQWDDRIAYKVELDLGEMLIEKDRFIYHLTDVKLHQHEDENPADTMIQWQAIQATFIGSNWQGATEETGKSEFYRNYILGNDPSRWKSRLHSFTGVSFKEFYPGIDLQMDGSQSTFKYSLIVQPGVDPTVIAMEYAGQDGLEIDEDGRLHILNQFGEIVESAPTAWMQESGKSVEVRFELVGTTVKFVLPNGYNPNETLVIDPSLTFSTFTGASADNWGMTATPDSQGNLFAGGIIFGLGYPVTVGAYQTGNNSAPGGSVVDVGITKFTANGTSLIYSTYLGGLASETPNSIVANAANELFIFGLTSSSNFPMAGTPYDPTFNGGPIISSSNSNGINFNAGSDLYIARLSADGTTLIASTYMGGSNTDGMNISSLSYNYGDQFRGEIILDPLGNVLVSSTTKSTDFPTMLGAQNALSGTQDAVLFKMPATLNSLIWSSYYGGTGEETGNSIEIAANGDVYVAGGTTSSNMSFLQGYDLSFGGVADGYVARFNGFTGANLSGTYIGIAEYDQSYFVQVDIDDKVYVLGQTESNLGITPGHYGNANSGQFIHKFNHNLTSVEWTTMIGAGTGHVELSPTAFLVSDCYDIYLSGWGGNLNVNHGSASFSTTNGFPVTPDGYQLATNGSNFWIGVLSQDAASMKYGTFFGGTVNLSDEHVDGGTCRFDKSGRIYHAVCGGCQGNSNGFTTTPGAWSTVNGSNNCNLAAFKFELSTIEAIVSTPNTVVCIPNPVVFNNNSANGNQFYWDFGDGTTSTDVNPSHVYGAPGTYTVTLVVADSNQCYSPDSVEFIVYIGDFGGGVVPLQEPICPGSSVQLEAYGGVNYAWTPAQFLDDPTIATPTATLNAPQDFMVVISDSCGIDTAYVTVDVHTPASGISNDTTICIGESVNLVATGGVDYQWSPPTYLSNSSIANPLCTPANSISYTVDILTADGCEVTEEVTVNVVFTPPSPVMPDSLTICEGASTQITVSGADSYFWSPNTNISSLTSNVVTVNPGQSMYYYCDFTNVCATVRDSVFIDVSLATILAGNDTILCPGQTAPIWAQGGVSYVWTPGTGLSNPYTSLTYSTPQVPTLYTVIGTDANGCVESAQVFVDLYPQPFIQTNPNVYAFYGDQVQLSATSTTPGPYNWYPTEFLSCVNCPNPVATPNQNYTYYVDYTDQNGCYAMDTVTIFYDPIIYVPNTFTPGDDDGHNPLFMAYGGNIQTFEMLIFNRWGELIYTIDDINKGWDGTFNDAECQDGTYIWKVRLTDLTGEEQILTGHVNLLR